MRRIRNEKGYALLLVMLMVVLFTIMGMGLLAMNMNAAKQFNTKEEQVQARHQAEMGILHYQAEIEKNFHPVIEDKSAFCVSLENLKQQVIGKYYSISASECEIENEKITFSFTSKGTAGVREEKIVEASIFFEKKTSGQGTGEGLESGNTNTLPTMPSNSVRKELNGLDVDNGTFPLGKANLYILGDLTVESGFNMGGSQIEIPNDLYIDGNMDLHNQGCVVVRNDLTVLDKIKFGNKIYLFVYGDANLPDDIQIHNNSEIFISGNVFINGKKQNPKPAEYTAVPSGNVYKGQGNISCQLPGPSIIQKQEFWDLNGKIEAIYK
ncbi:hypothetical protein [Planococcus sp. ISL-110]|uniref:hypothetical protein n=1 Tax=Planococcus sp. ISL-110 TaxID=2819167 RepID=UPI001BEA4FA9|nr:hypothetical protein [Planococcus sp. ISL-110]MBT2569227.1 hypothetical protein [Planococcus sp. ISL-110]